MKIWLIQTGEPLPVDESVRKMRAAIVAEILVDKGHSVLWWTSAFDHFRKDWIFTKDFEFTLKKNLKIKALKGIGYKKNISFSRFIDHRIVAWKFRKYIAKMRRPNIIVTSMPPHDLAWESVRFAKENKIPVLVDIRDPWPDIFLNYVPKGVRELAKIMLFRDFQMIKKTMGMADGLVAATNTFLEWGLNYADREKTWRDRVFRHGYKRFKVVNNSRILYKFKDLMEILEKKFIVFFVGTISRTYHNPSILLEVAKRLFEYKNIHFIIAGDGELLDELKKKAERYDNISLTGWLEQNEIEYLLQHSKIGVCPSTKVVDLPTNKVFAYLSAGLPILSAFHGEIKEIIEKYEIGFYYPPNDVDSLANYIKKLYGNARLYKKMSENAQKVFEKMFNADEIYEEYAEHIEKIVNDTW
ncbi:MAG: glycosyltransferase family 4 protein [Candidatus Hodarchaeota archaeon]